MDFDDYSEPYLKLEKLHKELIAQLLHGKPARALEITIKMQSELAKLQNCVWKVYKNG